MSEDLRRIDPEWIKKQSDSEARKEARKEKRKKVRPDDQEEYFAGRGIKRLASIFIGLAVVAIGFIGFCNAFGGDGSKLERDLLLSGIAMVAGIVTALSALLYYCFGVMVVKSVENTRNTTQMLDLMKQMMRMMEQQTASAAPDENGPQHAEEQAD